MKAWRIGPSRAARVTAAIVLVLLAVQAGARDSSDAHHEIVLAFEPAGYWPADEGAGQVLIDHSGNDNHGQLHRVPWDDAGLLDFRGRYQWAEIPHHPHYDARSFTVGGWVFTRGEIYGGVYPGREGMIFIGNAYHRSGYTLATLYDSPTLYRKSEWGVFGGTPDGFSLCLRNEQLVDVISGGISDALGSRAEHVAIETGVWQHVFYSYEAGMPVSGDDEWKVLQDWRQSYHAGRGTLYVNGALAASADSVEFTPRTMRLLVGTDALWWLQSDRSGSLDGSFKDLVFFDRALKADDVATLHARTRPLVEPHIRDDEGIIFDGSEDALDELASQTSEQLASAMAQRDSSALRSVKDELMTGLTAALGSWRTSRLATNLLVKLDNKDARSVLADALPAILLTLREVDAQPRARVEAALTLGQMGPLAGDAVPDLVATLEGLAYRHGTYLPRIEDLLRNAVIRALLDIDPDDETARHALGSAFARPILQSLDLSQTYLKNVAPLVEAGHYMDALDIYRILPLSEHGDRYISQGDPHRDRRGPAGNSRAYTTKADYGGFTYTLGEGESFAGVEPVSKEDFKVIIAEVAREYPRAKTWLSANTPHISRVKIVVEDSTGVVQTAYLEGERFIFDGRDGKVRGWSIAFDREGFIHITGGMHNAPNQAQFIPGSWERMGASRSHIDDDYPTMLYWVSRRPGDIESLEFAGQRRNPRNVPAPLGMCYMNFIQDREQELYLYGRIHVQGVQSWGLYRYDTSAKRWNALGGFAPDVTEEFPEWADRNIEMAADWLSLPTFRWDHQAPQNRVLAWARQPHFYNYMRGWGIRFDRTNRMHLMAPLFGFDADYANRNRNLYAYSDDGGETFYRADGTPLALPLTVNPGPGHAAMESDSTQLWWDLWHSLLDYAGYRHP